MITIAWPSLKKIVNAQVWRILDLSGLTKSVRDSRNYTRSGYVYLNGMNVLSTKETVSTGCPFYLELRFPNGRTKGEDMIIVPSSRLVTRKPRQASPGTNHFINDPSKTFYKG